MFYRFYHDYDHFIVSYCWRGPVGGLGGKLDGFLSAWCANNLPASNITMPLADACHALCHSMDPRRTLSTSYMRRHMTATSRSTTE